MFTGIVEAIGKISKISEEVLGKRFFIKHDSAFATIKVGDSVAVNGTCLTVTDIQFDGCWLDVVAETLRCTNLGLLSVGSLVNLESSLTLQKSLGGHIVQGHVDGTGTIIKIEPEGNAKLLTITFPEKLRPYLVNKGFIAMDGMSLTVIAVTDTTFTLTLIPHTQKTTISGNYTIGQVVNLESDIMAKYAENFYRLADRPNHCH